MSFGPMFWTIEYQNISAIAARKIMHCHDFQTHGQWGLMGNLSFILMKCNKRRN